MYRFSRPAAFLIAGMLAGAAPAAAQDTVHEPRTTTRLSDAALGPRLLDLPGPPDAAPPVTAERHEPRRPRALVPLYVSFASLQGLDAHSTHRALDRGAVEANPLMRGLASNPVGLVAAKAAATTGVIYAGEKMWKRNKVAAVVFMAAANSAMAWVVSHNYRAVR